MEDNDSERISDFSQGKKINEYEKEGVKDGGDIVNIHDKSEETDVSSLPIPPLVSRVPQDSDRKLIERRKERGLKLFKNYWVYVLLAIVVWIGVRIRRLNIPGLRDITTGEFTLGPDLDPFLFLRWTKEIVANGSLAQIDFLRNVPLGFNTAGESALLSYMMAYFHYILDFFNLTHNVTYSAIVFPVFMFALTTIAFFLFARKIFYKEDRNTRNLIAIISTALFVLVPSLLPRTIAGIPEKESAAFFFMFIAFYFFMEAFTNKKNIRGYVFGALAGIATGTMALIWGGSIFVFMTIPAAVLFSYVLGQVRVRECVIYGLWLLFAFMIMVPFTSRYSPWVFLTSFSTGTAIAILLMMGSGLFIMKNKSLEKYRVKFGNLPPRIYGLILALLVLIILVVIFMGTSFFTSRIDSVVNLLIEPSQSRFSFTVAENRQPFFANDWTSSFGPIYKDIPIYFLLFFIGAIFLFFKLIENLNSKEKLILMVAYIIFLSSIIFSRYSPHSLFNGSSFQSLFLYFGGALLFIIVFLYVYIKRYKSERLDIFKNINFSYITYFIILTLGIIGARGAIRLIMVLGAVTPVVIGFIIVKFSQKSLKQKDDMKKFLYWGITALVIIMYLFTLNSYYKHDVQLASSYVPSGYQFQWQNAMSWVRENTAEDAVFGHWWDYGYWLQSMGERATVLDGGNAIVYWNHLMGRHGLTGADEREALEFLYAHDTTHFLIDSTDIGKYTAYSSIGADENYDRYSWIPTLIVDPSQTRETSEETFYVYPAGNSLDEDILWKDPDGNEIFIPKESGVLNAIIFSQAINNDSQNAQFSQPQGIFFYNGQQYQIPLRFAYFNVQSNLVDFGNGLDAGVFVFPSVNQIQGGQVNMNLIGSMFYLSGRTVHSQLARLYLFDDDSDYFKLVHTQDNVFVQDLKSQGVDVGSFVYFQGLQGPIKIWEISYPDDIVVREEFLETEFPNSSIYLAQPGRY